MNIENDINRKRLLWAGSMAILAAGIGFGVRGSLFEVWAEQFNFNGSQLGNISLGAGFISFCFGIIIGGVIVDKIGYAKLVIVAFLLHILSAVVTFAVQPGMSTETAYNLLYWGTFLFGLANGTLEAVANPLVSTIFPKNRTHYLNILHASWPLGMVFGGVIGWVLGGMMDWGWKAQLSLYLIPTVVYGIMFFGQKYPKSEASAKGLKIGQMFKDVGILGILVVAAMLFLFLRRDVFTPIFNGSAAGANVAAAVVALALVAWVAKITNFAIGHWLIFVLFITHALVGSVELGTDGWIQNMTGTILTPIQGNILFVVTSLLMFVLRFMAHTIEKKTKISPIGLLFVCSMIAVLGLNLVASINTFGPALGAVLVYALGKTFFWPTMLAVIGDRFPATGAVAMSLMGGVGMMSVGLFGGPGLGYARDRFSAEELQAKNAPLYEEWKSEGDASQFSVFKPVQALDPGRLGTAKKAAVAVKQVAAGSEEPEVVALANSITEDQKTVVEADVSGNRKTLRVDSLIPVVMALIYLMLLLYFKAKGGYRPLTLADHDELDETAEARLAAQAHAGEA